MSDKNYRSPGIHPVPRHVHGLGQHVLQNPVVHGPQYDLVAHRGNPYDTGSLRDGFSKLDPPAITEQVVMPVGTEARDSVSELNTAGAMAEYILVTTTIDTRSPRPRKIHLMSGVLQGAAGDRNGDRIDHYRSYVVVVSYVADAGAFGGKGLRRSWLKVVAGAVG